jgi:hypothetical protein
MKISITIFIFLLSIATLGQKVSNNIQFPKGKNLYVNTEINSTTTMDVMGQSMQTSVTSNVTQTFSIKEVKNSISEIEHSIKQIEFNADGMGQKISFDSGKPEDLSSDIGKSFQTALNSKYTVLVNNKGTVTDVQADTSKKGKDDPMLGILMAQLNISTDPPKIGDATVFKILPDRVIKAGDTWTDSSTGESGKRITHYTLRTVSDKELILDFNEQSDLKTSQEVMGMKANIKTTSAGEGQIFIDRQTGILKEKESIIESNQTVEAQGQSLPSSSKMKIRITVSPLSP